MSWGRVSLHTALRTMMPCTQFHAGRCLFCLITFCYLSFLWFLMHPCGLCEAIFYLAIHKSLFFHHCRKTLTDWPGYLELAVTLITLVFCFVSFLIKIIIGKILVYFFFLRAFVLWQTIPHCRTHQSYLFPGWAENLIYNGVISQILNPVVNRLVNWIWKSLLEQSCSMNVILVWNVWSVMDNLGNDERFSDVPVIYGFVFIVYPPD